MRYTFLYCEQPFVIEAEPAGERLRVKLPASSWQEVSARLLANDQVEISAGDRVFRVPYVRTRKAITLAYGGCSFDFSRKTPGRKERVPGAASGVLAAPMTGSVAEVLVSEGQRVSAYQPLVVLEAMKVLA